jgi:hypothetical protein
MFVSQKKNTSRICYQFILSKWNILPTCFTCWIVW